MKARESASQLWPALPWEEWQETATTLHMWTQIVGKTRLMLTPLENHWWNAALYVTPRALSTWSMPYGEDLFDVEFDFVDHQLHVRKSSGGSKSMALRPQSVAAFYEEYLSLLRSLEITVRINPKPVEVSDPIPFTKDRQHASYDKEFAHRFLAHTEALGYSIQEFSRSLSRQVQPGSLLLGQLRFSGNQIFREVGAASSRCRCDYPGSILSRGDQRRILA